MIRGVLLLLLMLTGASAHAQVSASVVWHVVVHGDLDTTAMARDVALHLREADGARASLVVLQFDASGARLDVAWAIAEAMERMEAPVDVVVEPGKFVGPGVLLIGLVADGFWMGKGSRIVGGWNAAVKNLAPDETDWVSIERAATGALWTLLRDGGRPPELAGCIVSPTGEAWLRVTAGKQGFDLSLSRPTESAGWDRIVTTEPLGPSTLTIASDALVACGLAKPYRSIGDILSDRGMVATRQRFEVRSRLSAAREEVMAFIAEATETARSVEAALDRAEDEAKTRNPDGVLREAGLRGLAMIVRMHRLSERIEFLLAQTPEVLRTEPPGTAPASAVPVEKRAAAWSKAISDARQAIEKAQDRARRFADR